VRNNLQQGIDVLFFVWHFKGKIMKRNKGKVLNYETGIRCEKKTKTAFSA
jgi:hypothetical protein